MSIAELRVGTAARTGRPSLATPERLAAIVEAIGQGVPLGVAARANGVSYRRYREWRELGRSDDPKHARFRQFRLDCREAEARGEMAAFGVLRRAAVENGDYRAALALLERRWSRRWAKRTQQDIKIQSTSVLVSLEARAAFFADPGYRKAICDRDTAAEPAHQPRALPGPTGGDSAEG